MQTRDASATVLWWCSPANHLALSRQGPGFESLPEHFSQFTNPIATFLASVTDAPFTTVSYAL